MTAALFIETQILILYKSFAHSQTEILLSPILSLSQWDDDDDDSLPLYQGSVGLHPNPFPPPGFRQNCLWQCQAIFDTCQPSTYESILKWILDLKEGMNSSAGTLS